MRGDVKSLAVLAFAYGAVAVCAYGTVVTGARAAPLPIATATAPNAEDTAEARASYVARALADPHPPGVKGLRRVAVGTGFFIGPDKVLTNFHVVDTCTALTVGNNREGAESDAKLVAGDAALDLAVLSTDAMSVTPARFETAIPMETGPDLAIVGYPNHGLPVLEAELDLVSSVNADVVGNRRMYPFAGDVRRGNSGGPVLDKSGAVVGVVTAKVDTPAVYRKTGMLVDNVGFAIANRIVFDFLRANDIAFQPATPAASLSPEEILQHARGFVRQIGCWKKPGR